MAGAGEKRWSSYNIGMPVCTQRKKQDKLAPVIWEPENQLTKN